MSLVQCLKFALYFTISHLALTNVSVICCTFHLNVYIIVETRENYPYPLHTITYILSFKFSLLATFLLSFFLSPPLLVSIDHHFGQSTSILLCKIPFVCLIAKAFFPPQCCCSLLSPSVYNWLPLPTGKPQSLHSILGIGRWKSFTTITHSLVRQEESLGSIVCSSKSPLSTANFKCFHSETEEIELTWIFSPCIGPNDRSSSTLSPWHIPPHRGIYLPFPPKLSKSLNPDCHDCRSTPTAPALMSCTSFKPVLQLHAKAFQRLISYHSHLQFRLSHLTLGPAPQLVPVTIAIPSSWFPNPQTSPFLPSFPVLSVAIAARLLIWAGSSRWLDSGERLLVITSSRPTKLALLAMPLPLPQAQVQVPHVHPLVSALFHVPPPEIIGEGIRGEETHSSANSW